MCVGSAPADMANMVCNVHLHLFSEIFQWFEMESDLSFAEVLEIILKTKEIQIENTFSSLHAFTTNACKAGSDSLISIGKSCMMI